MTTHPLFQLGRVVATPGGTGLDQHSVLVALARYAQGDWGDLCAEDIITNDEAVFFGNRILGAYADSHDTKFWIITEADRSVTTILLPDEY